MAKKIKVAKIQAKHGGTEKAIEVLKDVIEKTKSIVGAGDSQIKEAQALVKEWSGL